MTIKAERRFEDEVAASNVSKDRPFPVHRPARGRAVPWRCPNCGSTDLRKVSLVYEQGLSQTVARSRWSGFMLGDVAVGRTVTRSIHESALSVRLRPPAKWSYGKLLWWSALISFVLLILYIHAVMGSSTPAFSLGAVSYLLLFPLILLVCVFLVWKHNSFFYPRELKRWNRSVICRRCGAVSKQALAD